MVPLAELAQQPANGTALGCQQVAKRSLLVLVRSRGPLGLASEPNPRERGVLARAWEQMVRSGLGCWPARTQIREPTPTWPTTWTLAMVYLADDRVQRSWMPCLLLMESPERAVEVEVEERSAGEQVGGRDTWAVRYRCPRAASCATPTSHRWWA